MNIWKSIINKTSSLLLLLLIMSSCASISAELNRGDIDSTSVENFDKLTKTQQILIKSAIDSCSVGYPSNLKFNNKLFTNDCSGLIYGIFWSANIDLISLTAKESGNGVKRLFSVLNRKNLIHKNKLPNPGDLVFWNNTYGSWGNNPLSHIGIVVSVNESTGSVDYVHNNTYLGQIRRETMNLYKPHENRPINNYMRYDSKYKKTAAELFDSFGMAWKL